eukprot:jgi/Tetstr1/440875/TSEL_029148.t1
MAGMKATSEAAVDAAAAEMSAAHNHGMGCAVDDSSVEEVSMFVRRPVFAGDLLLGGSQATGTLRPQRLKVATQDMDPTWETPYSAEDHAEYGA